MLKKLEALRTAQYKIQQFHQAGRALTARIHNAYPHGGGRRRNGLCGISRSVNLPVMPGVADAAKHARAEVDSWATDAPPTGLERGSRILGHV